MFQIAQPPIHPPKPHGRAKFHIACHEPTECPQNACRLGKGGSQTTAFLLCLESLRAVSRSQRTSRYVGAPPPHIPFGTCKPTRSSPLTYFSYCQKILVIFKSINFLRRGTSSCAVIKKPRVWRAYRMTTPESLLQHPLFIRFLKIIYSLNSN